MRYKLPSDRLVNMLIPHFISGRKYILFLQSLVYPLKTLNDWFLGFSRQKTIEAKMTSQVIHFEWFLNYMFGRFLADPQQKIYIADTITVGVDMYHENALYSKPCTVWYEGEIVATVNPQEEPRPFHFLSEEKTINKVSFSVCVPQINIEEQEFVYMLSYVVNNYKLAGKTYLIKIDSKEIIPINKSNA